MDSLSKIRTRIKKALIEQGNYSKDMDTLIDVTAGNVRAYQIAVSDVDQLTESYISEVSREGNIKLVPHPAFKVMREQSEVIRKYLRELRLTLSTVLGGENDELDDLMNDINSTTDDE